MTEIVIPTSADELEEMLNDNNRITPVFKDPKLYRQFVANYAKSWNKRNADALAAQREQMQVILADLLKENGVKGNGLKVDLSESGAPSLQGLSNSGSYRKHRLYNKAAPGASVNKLFGDQAAFFQALSLKCNALGTHKDAPELLTKLVENERIRNSFGTNVPADGGFLVPEDFRSDLLMIALEQTIIRQ